MKEFGVDISKWQGAFDFDAAIAEGVKFAVLKGGGGDDGLYTDGRFVRNYKEAKARALPVGVYWFSRALTVEDAQREAEYCYRAILKGRQFELPVYMDVEDRAQLAIGKDLLTEVITAWCDYLAERGYYVGVYSTANCFARNMHDDRLKKYTHWIAYWGTKCNYTDASCLGMWQFGGDVNLLRDAKVAGVVCDQNYMLVDFPSIIRAAGLNGFAAEKPSGGEAEADARDNEPDGWARDAVNFAVKNKILYGDEHGNYKLHSGCTRQEMLIFLYRYYKLLKKEN